MKPNQLRSAMYRSFSILCCVLLCAPFSCQLNRTQFIDKLFNRPAEESVSQFPPVVEFLVQKIQSQYSNYVYEDLSRPSAWNKPVYTLSPQDQAFFASTTPNTTTAFNEDKYEYVDIDNSTEIFFEIIVNKNEDKNRSVIQDNGDRTTERLFEIIKTSEYPGNKTFVYITPKKPTTTSTYKEIEKIKND